MLKYTGLDFFIETVHAFPRDPVFTKVLITIELIFYREKY